ncbi:hypothetical protein ACFL26_00820 [Patescibacteria group bacterium]
MRKGLFVFIIITMFAVPLSVSAAVFESGEAYMHSTGETVEGNLYAAGGNVQISGAVNGDLLTAGGNVTIGGNVRDDLHAAGGTVVLVSNVGGDARMAGGNVMLMGQVGQELVAVGGMISAAPSMTVGGDAILSGGRIVVDGVIDGDLVVYGEEVDILGEVRGSVMGEVNRLRVMSGASVGGNIVYEALAPADIDTAATVTGTVDFTRRLAHERRGKPGMGFQAEEFKRSIVGAIVAWAFVKYVAVLLAALVLVAAFRKRSEMLAVASLADFWTKVLYGLAVAVLMPLALFLLLLTGFGISLSFLGFAVYAVLVAVGSVFAGIVLGVWLRRLWTKSRKIPADWKSVLLGVTLIHLVIVVPVLGWLFKCAFFLAALGAFSHLVWKHLRPRSTKK